MFHHLLFQCYELHSSYDPLLQSVTFWLEGVLLAVIGAFGLLGNVITLYVLPKVRN